MDVLLVMTNGGADILVNGNDVAADHGLQTAIAISLFSDGRASENVDGGKLRGWWPDSAIDRFGSLLWLLGREKVTPATVQRAEEYATASLSWLVEEGISSSVRVTAAATGQHTISLNVSISRGGNKRYESLWRGVSIMREAEASGNTFMLSTQYGIKYALDLSSGDYKVS